MAKSVAFGAHLKRPAKPGQAWKKFRRGEISAAEAKAKLGRAPRKRK